jgi:hypothetical protein
VGVLLTMAAAAAISNGATSSAGTADIVWTTSVDETGRPSDVLTGGTLIAAGYSGSKHDCERGEICGAIPLAAPSKNSGTPVIPITA